MIICPKCNKELPDGSLFCDACGAQIEAQDTAPQTAETAPEVKKPSFDIKKIAVLGVAAIAVIALVIFLGSLIFGGGAPDYALYIKDGEMVYSNFKKSFEVTDDLADGLENSQLANNASGYGYYTYLTEDGSKLFYIDKTTDDKVLYYRNPSKPKSEPVKLDSGVGYFMVSENGKIVTYLKDDTLYQHDLKEKTKIKSDVVSYVASLDAKKIIFETKDGDLILKNGKNEDKIASDIDNLHYVSKDFSKIYWEKENAIYLKNGKADAKKICSEVYNVIEFYEDGSFYYTEGVDEEDTDTDAETEYPTEIGDIIDQMIEENTKTLCFYNGKEKKVIDENYYGDYRTSSENQVIAYTAIDTSAINEENYEEGLYEFEKWYIAIEEKSTAIDLEDIYSVRVAQDGKTAYAWTVEEKDDEADSEAEEEEPTATLYKIKLSGKVEKAEKIDEEVYPYSVRVTSAANIIYFKDVDEGKGTLFIDKQKIDDDVELDDITYLKDSKKIVYFVDWDDEKSKGTLYIATLKGKSTKVGDDVATYEITPDEDILFIKDYKNNKGELYRFSGSKAKKLDDDVVAIIPYYSYTKAIVTGLGWIKD